MKRTILAIDDDAETLYCLTVALKTLGYQAIGAQDGAEGLRLARQHQPDLILVDLMMPNMDGFEVCRRLRADPATSEIPVAILSALSSLADQTAGMELGVSRYLIKPVSINQLAKVIDEVVATGEVAISAER
jgi:CheY-like chemotaxis protein